MTVHRTLFDAPPAAGIVWDASSEGFGAIILCAILGPVALFVVLVRLWARRIIQKNNIWIDDWLVGFAMIPAIGMIIGTCLATYPSQSHSDAGNIPVSERIRQYKLVFATEICYIFAAGLVKIAVLCFYRRFSRTAISRYFVWTVWAMILFVIAYVLTAVCVLVTSCVPVQATWLQVDPEWTSSHVYACGGRGFKIVLGSIVSCVQDLIATLLPFALLFSLSSSRKEKFMVSLMFSGGFIVSAAGAWRAYATYENEWSTDFAAESRNTYLSYIATNVELLCGIILSSLPSLRVFIRNIHDPEHNIFGRSIFRSRTASGDVPPVNHPSVVTMEMGSNLGEYRETMKDFRIDGSDFRAKSGSSELRWEYELDEGSSAG